MIYLDFLMKRSWVLLYHFIFHGVKENEKGRGWAREKKAGLPRPGQTRLDNGLEGALRGSIQGDPQ